MKNTPIHLYNLKIIVNFLVFILFLLLISTTKYVRATDVLPINSKTYLIVENVNIVNVIDGNIIENQQLHIKNGVITTIEAAGIKHAYPSNILDAQGGYLTPGLFDMHVHLHDRKYLMLNIAYGVTSVRSMSGQKMHLRWKEELANQEWLGSNLYLSSPILAGKDSHILNQAISTPEEGRQQVRKAKNNGFDFIKLYGYLPANIFEAIIEESRNIGIAVAKHGPHPAKGSNWTYLEGLQSLEHAEDIFQGLLNYQFDHEKLSDIASKIKATNVPVVPTLATFDHLTQLSNHKQTFIDAIELDYINPLYRDIQRKYAVERWLQDDKQQSAYHVKKQQFLFTIVNVLNQHNVKLLVGSDAGTMYTLPGISTHKEMHLLKQAGLNNAEILKAATINAAQTLNVDDKYGSIEVGKIADLVLVNKNPLDDITVLSTPKAVIKNGQWLNENDLAYLKAESKNTDSYFWSLLLLLEDIIRRQFS